MGRWRHFATAILTFTLFTTLILPSEAQPKPIPQPQPQQPKPQQPGPLPQQPKPQQPGPLPQQPKPQQPGPLPQQPKPQQPGPLPQQPKLQQPGPLPQQPAGPLPQQPKPQQPGPLPQQPGPLPQQPKPQQPGPLPQQPGPQQPQQPAGPKQPGPQPVQQGPPNDGGLTVGYYAKSCPKVENIVADVVKRAQQKTPTIPAALIRMLFHDCWVKGCDASILLDQTPNGGASERMGESNGQTIRGLEVYDEIKAQLEKECPKTVSCADIIAFAAREAVVLAGLPRYDVTAGRLDSRTSRADDADNELPTPNTEFQEVVHQFEKRQLSIEDLVALSGAHSIGQSQCVRFVDRLYKYRPGVPRDPSIDPAYADELAKKCPENRGGKDKEINFLVEFDPVTPLKLDNQYYLNVQKKRGLLPTDQVLLTDPRTAPLVNQMAADNEGWGKKFNAAMQKMGRVGVLTDKEDGEIRINCRASNN